ncbi:MAG: hypothetical protein PHE67_04855 [Campylobacterales bacterium]|nr:hypothetical protein [Campylobacterales bacterium]
MASDIKIVSGIDALYFFIESNEDYDSLYLELLDMYQDTVDGFTRDEVEYKNEDITFDINGCTLVFLGKAQGFHWFKDLQGFFKIGFKDRYKNRSLHNIQVQLTAKGIYTVGIKSIVEILDLILGGYTTGLKPITRADLNAFVVHDFSFVSKDMFVTKKKLFSEFNHIGSKNSTSTIYIGKKPFLLRLYNKKKELFAKKEKIELMDEYLGGFDIDINSEAPLWNIEFELHRAFFKSYGVLTVENLLENAESIFKNCMEEIRLIDTGTLTQEMIDGGHSNRAVNLPIWDSIKDNYQIDSFMQSPITLKRLKRKEYKYTQDKAMVEHVALCRKAKLHGLILGLPFYKEVMNATEESFSVKSKLKDELDRLKERFEEIKVFDMDSGEIYTERLDKQTNSVHRVSNIVSINSLSDYELYQEHERLISALLRHPIGSMEEKTAVNKVVVSRNELIKRGLIENEPMPF